MAKIKLADIKLNPNNPQKFNNLSKLESSVSDFPKMFKYRPIVIDNDNMVLGGNKRIICLRKLGFKEIPGEWVKRADDLTEDEQKRFIIADNVGFGEWDFDILANEWNEDDLTEWGLDLPIYDNQEIPDFDEQKVNTDCLVEKCPKCGFEWEK